ncbi:RNA-binding transcriptional accessory protein, partial [Frankia casuarinae]
KPSEFVDDTFGLPTVTDILAELEKPGRDPRPAFRTAAFTEGIETLADLVPGMTLEGTVTNVAAFGAFVDIGVHQDGLVHVSAMSKNFVSDPREVVKPGDIVTVKVLDVDIPRKRISLTLRLDDEAGAGGPGRRDGEGDRRGAAGAGAGRGGSRDHGDRRNGGRGTASAGAGRGGSRDHGDRRNGGRGTASGERGGAGGRGAGGAGGRGAGGRNGSGGRGGSSVPDGAIAEALRRAGIVNGDQITLGESGRKRG